MWALCLNAGRPVRGVQSSVAREGTRMTAETDEAATKQFPNPLLDGPRTRSASELAHTIAAKFEHLRRHLRHPSGRRVRKLDHTRSLEAQIRAAADRLLR